MHQIWVAGKLAVMCHRGNNAASGLRRRRKCLSTVPIINIQSYQPKTVPKPIEKPEALYFVTHPSVERRPTSNIS